MLYYNNINRANRTQALFKTGDWFFNVHTREGWWSDEVYNFYGLNPKQGIPSPEYVKSFYPAAEYERMTQKVHLCFTERTIQNDVYQAIMPNGKSAWHFSSCEPVMDDADNLLGVYGIMLDITEFHSLQYGLSQSESSFNALVTNLEEVIFHSKPDTELIFFSPAWHTLTGFEIKDSLGLMMESFIAEEDISKMQQAFDTVRNEAVTHINFECRVKTRAGITTWCSFYVSPIYNLNNALIGYTGRIKDITKLKGYLGEIEKQRNFYESILNSVPSQICAFNDKGRYIFINKKAIADDELRTWLMGKNDIEYCAYRNKPIEIALERKRQREIMMKTASPVTYEEVFDDHGKKIYQQRSQIPIYDENGNFLFGICYGFNTSELKNQQLINKKLQTAIDSATECVAIKLMGDDGLYTYANKAFAKLIGLSDPEDVIGKKWTETFKYAFITPSSDALKNALIENGHWTGEIITQSTQGEHRHIMANISVLQDNELLYICREISDEIAKNKELDKLALVASKTNSIVLITDKEARIEWVNEGFTKTFGYTLEEALGKRALSELLAAKSDPVAISSIKDAMLKNIDPSGEIKLYAKNGEPIWVYYTVSSVRNEKGEVTNYIGVHNNITSIKDAENAMLEALEKEKKLSELKSRFISLASHEFRTPLTGIQTSIDIINALTERAYPELNREIKAHITRINEQVDKIGEVMNNVLLAGKMDAGKLTLVKEKGHLAHFIQHIISQIALNEDKSYFGINIDIEGAAVEQYFDHRLIEHIIRNLLSNAFKYSIGKPIPEINIHYTQHNSTITVKDYGIGIPTTEQDNIFESFFRATNAYNIRGTGLGLVLVKQFVEMHNGSIYFTSALNQGTTFYVSIPL